MTKFLGDYDITIIEFLDQVLPEYLKENDISVTKFLDSSIGTFLNANDITVTKFMEEKNGDISVTKFLTDTAVSNVPLHQQRNTGPVVDQKANLYTEGYHNPTWDDVLHWQHRDHPVPIQESLHH